MRPRAFVGLVLVVIVGCGGKPYKTAQVSGKVTLDGKPLAKASITFIPMSTKENPNPGPTAFGVSDNEGRYTIYFDQHHPGAVVGKCRLYVTTILPDSVPSADDRDAGGPVKKFIDKVPAKYRDPDKTLVMDVPAAGSDKMDIALSSR